MSPAVHVNADELKSILACLPRQQHDTAKRKILLAESIGYRGIFLWFFPPFVPDAADLVGTDAKGEFGFLAEPNEYQQTA